jgi:hypothetical protein
MKQSIERIAMFHKVIWIKFFKGGEFVHLFFRKNSQILNNFPFDSKNLIYLCALDAISIKIR